MVSGVINFLIQSYHMKSVFMMCSFIVLSVGYARAQDVEEPDTIVNYLDEITVSANRWEQNLREVPNSVSKVSAALVKFQNPQTAADLLAISNSVFVQKSQLGGGSPMIRGFATNRVLLVVDGVRMNNAIFRSGNVQNVISLDPNSIHEAEVVFGPGSVIYGSDAIGGVMDFHTLRPAFGSGNELNFQSNAFLRYATANREKTAHVDFNIGTKKWAFLTSITRSDFDDLKMGSDGPVEYTRPDYVVRESGDDVVRINEDPNVQVSTGYDQWNVLQKISFQPTTWTSLTYGFHYSKTSDYSRYDRLILKEEGSFSNAEWYYGPQKWMMHNLNFTYSKPASLFDEAKVVMGVQGYEESRHSRAFGSARRTDRTEKVDAFSVNVDLDKSLGDLLTVYYGAEFVTNTVTSIARRQHVENGEVTPVSTRYPDDSQWRTAAGYVSLKIRPAPKWVINLSNRFTSVYTHAKFDKAFFDFPFHDATLKNKSMNGSLGFIYSPSSAWKLYSNLSSGFRAPNVDDIGKVFDSEPGNVVVPNPRLEPERAYSAEVGFASFIENKIKVDFAAYYTVIDNAIARGTTTFNGEDSIDYDGALSRVLSQQNISNVSVAGLQAGLDWKITPEFSLLSNLNIQKGREKDPETGRDFSPTHVAPLFGATHLLLSKKIIKADLYVNYNGEIGYANLPLSERADRHLYAKDRDGNPYAPGWWTLNAKGDIRINEHFSASVGIENIFDKRYRPYSSGISAPGRNFILSVRAAF
jgi:hemoglobin/transferrin/lactoferrin receptor protein